VLRESSPRDEVKYPLPGPKDVRDVERSVLGGSDGAGSWIPEPCEPGNPWSRVAADGGVLIVCTGVEMTRWYPPRLAGVIGATP
jgi:hypothetical protein